MDNSETNNSLIQKIYINKETSVNNEAFTSITKYEGEGSGGTITAGFQVTCMPNHFGTDCSTFCKNVTGDKFTCDENGSRVCLTGWTNPDYYCQTCEPMCIWLSFICVFVVNLCLKVIAVLNVGYIYSFSSLPRGATVLQWCQLHRKWNW